MKGMVIGREKVVDLVRSSCLKTAKLAREYRISGRDKEKKLLQSFKRVFEALATEACFPVQLSDPYDPVKFEVPGGLKWYYIDLVIEGASQRFACECKFKTKSDGAVPDNRKDAFLDLYKCELYSDSAEYDEAFFLWFTDVSRYLKQPKLGEDSRAFSTHHGRIYAKNTPLHAKRARKDMPLPLSLGRDYRFQWYEATTDLYVTAFQITKLSSMPLF